MPDMNCRVKCFGSRVTLSWGILGLVMLLPAAVWAGGSTVKVPPPNHSDDTASIQGALDACVAYGKGCTVQLAAGTYLTSQLVEYNFQGTFKGMGQNKTTIQALPNLPVADFAQGACKPNTSTCLWPSLIIFVDGNITVSDLTVNEPNIPATQPWFGLDVLNDGIYFTGQNRTNASVQRVTVKGTPDNSPSSCPDFNLCNGVVFAGELPRTPSDYYFLSGTFSLSKSSFTNVQLGVGVYGFLRDSKVTIGGSPTAGNVFQNVDIGSFTAAAQNSVEEVSYNTAAGNWDSMLIAPWSTEFVPSKPSLYLVHDNNLMPAGPYVDGIYMADDPTNHWLYALVYNNTIDAQDIGPAGGIDVVSTTDTTILNNKISGNGGFGIGISDGSHVAVLKNDVTGFTADPGGAQIILDGSLLWGVPDTRNSTVVCKTPSDTVMDLGTNDRVIGCQQTANSTAAASAMIARPKALKKKPFVH